MSHVFAVPLKKIGMIRNHDLMIYLDEINQKVYQIN